MINRFTSTFWIERNWCFKITLNGNCLYYSIQPYRYSEKKLFFFSSKFLCIELTDEHLSELVVCEAVINETLRLYPTAPFFARTCIREHTIGTERQLRIPKGTSVLVNSYILHRRSDFWPRPLEFDYTRWMRDPKTGLRPKLPHPFAYLPFAAGPRNCIGQNFALLEAKIMLAMFVQRCNFEMVSGQKIVPDVKITMRYLFAYVYLYSMSLRTNRTLDNAIHLDVFYCSPLQENEERTMYGTVKQQLL